MMTCDEIQADISAYIDGELPADDMAVMFKHLSGCAECQGFLTNALRLRSAMHVPSALAATPLPRPKSVQQRSIRRLIGQRLELPFAAAAGIALVLLSVSLLSLSLWLNAPKDKPQREVVYMLSLPPVEIQAVRPAEQKPVH